MTISELLELPVEQLERLDTPTLTAILKPYFAMVREPLLPPDKPTKKGLMHGEIMKALAVNADKIAKLKESRGQ